MNSVRQAEEALLLPTLTRQCWGFMIGGGLFAVGSAITIWDLGSTGVTNWLCFIGAWFFTASGLFQLARSGPATVAVTDSEGRQAKAFRAEWLAAATQSIGTILFNVSTAAALSAKSIDVEKDYMWNPDAGGSVAFLISAVLVYLANYRSGQKLGQMSTAGRWSAHINMIGCLAFAVSAVGAFILDDGAAKDSVLANWGTFIGALCFVLASAIALPQLPWNRRNN